MGFKFGVLGMKRKLFPLYMIGVKTRHYPRGQFVNVVDVGIRYDMDYT
jgi:hypothetical protein